jgi:hypothetical protein
MGKKSRAPGKNLQRFIAGNFGIQPNEQLAIVEFVSDAVSDVADAVREAMTLHDEPHPAESRVQRSPTPAVKAPGATGGRWRGARSRAATLHAWRPGGGRMIDSIAVNKAPMSTGLVRWIAKPASRERALSASCP